MQPSSNRRKPLKTFEAKVTDDDNQPIGGVLHSVPRSPLSFLIQKLTFQSTEYQSQEPVLKGTTISLKSSDDDEILAHSPLEVNDDDNTSLNQIKYGRHNQGSVVSDDVRTFSKSYEGQFGSVLVEKANEGSEEYFGKAAVERQQSELSYVDEETFMRRTGFADLLKKMGDSGKMEETIKNASDQGGSLDSLPLAVVMAKRQQEEKQKQDIVRESLQLPAQDQNEIITPVIEKEETQWDAAAVKEVPRSPGGSFRLFTIKDVTSSQEKSLQHLKEETPRKKNVNGKPPTKTERSQSPIGRVQFKDDTADSDASSDRNASFRAESRAALKIASTYEDDLVESDDDLETQSPTSPKSPKSPRVQNETSSAVSLAQVMKKDLEDKGVDLSLLIKAKPENVDLKDAIRTLQRTKSVSKNKDKFEQVSPTSSSPPRSPVQVRPLPEAAKQFLQGHAVEQPKEHLIEVQHLPEHAASFLQEERTLDRSEVLEVHPLSADVTSFLQETNPGGRVRSQSNASRTILEETGTLTRSRAVSLNKSKFQEKEQQIPETLRSAPLPVGQVSNSVTEFLHKSTEATVKSVDVNELPLASIAFLHSPKHDPVKYQAVVQPLPSNTTEFLSRSRATSAATKENVPNDLKGLALQAKTKYEEKTLSSSSNGPSITESVQELDCNASELKAKFESYASQKENYAVVRQVKGSYASLPVQASFIKARFESNQKDQETVPTVTKSIDIKPGVSVAGMRETFQKSTSSSEKSHGSVDKEDLAVLTRNKSVVSKKETYVKQVEGAVSPTNSQRISTDFKKETETLSRVKSVSVKKNAFEYLIQRSEEENYIPRPGSDNLRKPPTSRKQEKQEECELEDLEERMKPLRT